MSERHTTLYLVRHGSTPANEHKPRILQGSGVNTGLSELGQRQAQCVAGWFRDMPIDAIYCSPLQRAIETATAISQSINQPLRVLDGVQEVNVGIWERHTWDTIREQFPVEYDLFHSDCGRHGYLGGESYSDVQRRIVPVFKSLLDQHVGESIVVVAHSVVNLVYLCTLLNLEMKQARGLPQDNCAVNVIRTIDGQPKVVTLNLVNHLDSLQQS